MSALKDTRQILRILEDALTSKRRSRSSPSLSSSTTPLAEVKDDKDASFFEKQLAAIGCFLELHLALSSQSLEQSLGSLQRLPHRDALLPLHADALTIFGCLLRLDERLAQGAFS